MTDGRSLRLPKYRPPTSPGEMLLEEFLKPLGLSQRAFAQRIGVPASQVYRLIREESDMSALMALRLARVFGMSVEFWLNLTAVGCSRDSAYQLRGLHPGPGKMFTASAAPSDSDMVTGDRNSYILDKTNIYHIPPGNPATTFDIIPRVQNSCDLLSGV